MKRKILFLTDTGNIIGGGEISFLNLLEHVDRNTFEVYVALPGEGDLSRRIRELKIPLFLFSYKRLLNPFNFGNSLQSLNKLVDFIRDKQIDLVHTNSTGGVMFLAALACKITAKPLVSHIRIFDSGWISDFLQGILSDRIIMISERLRRKFVFLPFRRKTSVIYNGVDIQNFSPNVSPEIFRQSIGCSSSTMLIGTVGSYQSGKGFEYLIRAFALVRQQLGDVKLVLVGLQSQPRYMEYIRKLLLRLDLNDSVVLLERRKDVPAILSALDVFVFPSLIDAFGRVMIEAMSSAKPVIAFNRGAADEIVVDQETGFLVKPRNFQQLAQRLKLILSDKAKREELGTNSLKRCKEMFDINLHARNIEKLYMQLLKDETAGYVACALCASNDSQPINTCVITAQDARINEKTLTLCRCKNCGLVYVNPRPEIPGDKTGSLYKKEYFESGYMKFYSDESKDALQSNEPFDFRMSLIEKFKKKGVLLDVGCATGGFLSYAQERGWNTAGIDISDFALDVARGKGNLYVTKGTLEEVNFKECFFDVICVGDVIEHTRDPLLFLKEAGRILKQDGILYLALPDFGSLHYGVMSAISRFNHKNYFVLPHHLYHFTRKTLEDLLCRSGFIILQIQKTESKPQEKGLKKIFMRSIFSVARLFNMQDRIVVIAKKLL